MDVECGTNPDHDPGGKFAGRVGHKAFLLGRAQPNPEKIWFQPQNRAFELFELFSGERPERRAVGSYDFYSRESGEQRCLELFRDSRGGTMEEVRITLLHRACAYFHHEVGSKNAFHAFEPLQPSNPDGWHAVWHS